MNLRYKEFENNHQNEKDFKVEIITELNSNNDFLKTQMEVLRKELMQLKGKVETFDEKAKAGV